MNKNYLQLEFASGNFFKYSKTEEQGYEKHVSTKGNTSYRKYYKEGITGVLDSVSIYAGKFGNSISMTIKNGDDIFYAPVDLSDQKGNVDSYAESLIKLLPQLEKGMTIAVRGYNFIPEGEKYSKNGMSILVDGVKLKSTMTNAYISKEGTKVDGDIPALVWKKDALGKNKPTAVSQEAKNDYLLEVLKEQTDRLKWVGSSDQQVDVPQQPSQKAPLTATPEQAFEKPKAESKLPF